MNEQSEMTQDNSTPDTADSSVAGEKAAELDASVNPSTRPDALSGSTYKIVWPASPHATYVTISDIIEDGQRRPFEMFINSKNMEHYAWTVALTRMISAVFRRGGDISFVAEELKAIFDPQGGEWIAGQYVPSLLAAIGGVIERHLEEIAGDGGRSVGLGPVGI